MTQNTEHQRTVFNTLKVMDTLPQKEYDAVLDQNTLKSHVYSNLKVNDATVVLEKHKGIIDRHREKHQVLKDKVQLLSKSKHLLSNREYLDSYILPTVEKCVQILLMQGPQSFSNSLLYFSFICTAKHPTLY